MPICWTLLHARDEAEERFGFCHKLRVLFSGFVCGGRLDGIMWRFCRTPVGACTFGGLFRSESGNGSGGPENVSAKAAVTSLNFYIRKTRNNPA